MLDGYVVARVERVNDFHEEVYQAEEAHVEDLLVSGLGGGGGGGGGTPAAPAPGSSSYVSIGTGPQGVPPAAAPPESSSSASFDIDSSASSSPLASSSATPIAGASSTTPTSSSAGATNSNRTLVRTRSNEELMRECHEFLEQLKEGTPWVVQHLDRNYVPMPSDPAQFSFWMTLVSSFAVIFRVSHLCVRGIDA